ncbi:MULTISPECIES: hypothetical protein [unclassified Thauera]|uniref:hypothetical protein n=1 Tax=unclassified Thauera TaxID=2609274 RepID=UPI0021E192F7|nr:hypothetical protein [Thauera sp. Sel9]
MMLRMMPWNDVEGVIRRSTGGLGYRRGRGRMGIVPVLQWQVDGTAGVRAR